MAWHIKMGIFTNFFRVNIRLQIVFDSWKVWIFLLSKYKLFTFHNIFRPYQSTVNQLGIYVSTSDQKFQPVDEVSTYQKPRIRFLRLHSFLYDCVIFLFSSNNFRKIKINNVFRCKIVFGAILKKENSMLYLQMYSVRNNRCVADPVFWCIPDSNLLPSRK